MKKEDDGIGNDGINDLLQKAEGTPKEQSPRRKRKNARRKLLRTRGQRRRQRPSKKQLPCKRPAGVVGAIR